MIHYYPNRFPGVRCILRKHGGATLFLEGVALFFGCSSYQSTSLFCFSNIIRILHPTYLFCFCISNIGTSLLFVISNIVGKFQGRNMLCQQNDCVMIRIFLKWWSMCIFCTWDSLIFCWIFSFYLRMKTFGWNQISL